MKLSKAALLVATHLTAAGVGLMVGLYSLPILIAPPAPTEQAITATYSSTLFKAQFHRELQDSDALHWGEGDLAVGSDFISLMGKLAPGPDYKLYLSPEFVETEAAFNRLKPNMVVVGDINTFDNFLLAVPNGINPADYNSVIIWCESFGQFITSAKYQ